MPDRPRFGINLFPATSEDLSPDHIHYKALVTYEANLADLKRDHPGEWVAIKDDKILGISFDRHELLKKFHTEEYIPILVRQIPKP